MSDEPSTSSSGPGLSDDSDLLERSIGTTCSISSDTYLTFPEEISSLSTISDLQNAIAHCKALVLEKEDSEEKKWLVRRLIELRLRLEDIRQTNEENVTIDDVNNRNKVVLGHHFSLQNYPVPTVNLYCDRCSGIIWNVLHNWYLCADCDYKCHVRCLSEVCRICAHVIITENPKFNTDICPEAEDGLASQNYRCAECLTHTAFKNGVAEPRLCEYNGKYYCPTCHWNSTSVIPARVILNWDFKERKVCRASKQILKLMTKLPVLKLEELNPTLFATIEELTTVKNLRQQLIQIKKYLTSCKTALECDLLWNMADRYHFVENENSYSIQDLLDLRSGELIQYLNKIRDTFIKHIKVDCQVCYGRGFCCELCSDEKVIFPFEPNVISCTECLTAFHFNCWVKTNQQCRKCERIQERLTKLESSSLNPFDEDS
ncbi:UNVERIFIED_CONTAM: hypothetical protein PYX00_001300 [Menopon gallinae]|uniref:Phorbol-ester/DAG-type domain-containing protein n=1 Tax=Menopon gallinae TaxID=328185 RepID=A0AAW2IDJ9_9NEOP